MGNCDSCFWQVVGTGQFRPIEGLNPFLGPKGGIEKVEETKLECTCDEAKIKDIVAEISTQKILLIAVGDNHHDACYNP